MNELLELLSEVKPSVDFANEEKLIEDRLLDSFDILQIVNGMIDTFDIEISAADIVPENFNSVNAMWAMVQRLEDK